MDLQDNQFTVWDPLVRLFHWSLVFFFFLAYLLDASWPSLHSHAGNIVALLVLFRLLWGVIGTMHARFSDFVTGPRRALAYLMQLLRGESTTSVGHNPVGAIMILTLLSSLFVTAFTGISLFAIQGSGPLKNTLISDWPGHLVEDIHAFLAEFTMILIVLHVLGVLVTSRLQKQNLTLSMINGRKRRQTPVQKETQ